MGKQYAFWRKPDGRPSKRDEQQYAPRALLRSVGVESQVVNGQVTWPILSLHFYEAALNSLIVILRPDGTELDAHTSSRFVTQAISSTARNAGGGKPLVSDLFLDHIDIQAREMYQTAVCDYVLVTSLSTSGFPAKSIRVEECEISPIGNRRKGKYSAESQEPILSRHPEVLNHYHNSQYQIVRVKTSGRTKQEAIGRALGAINYLRGTMNHLGSNQLRISSGSNPQPIGVVRLGALHSLHDSGGAVIGPDSFWYERGYKSDQKLFAPKDGWAKFDAVRRQYMRRISRLPYSDQMKDILIRYAFALDESDYDIAFMHLWRLIERITDTIGARYEETIKRAAWIFSDHEVPREMLSALRTRRNVYVHSGESASDMEPVAYLAKSIVDPHIASLIHNVFDVSCLKEYGETLALPMDRELLLKRSRRLALVANKRWAS